MERRTMFLSFSNADVQQQVLVVVLGDGAACLAVNTKQLLGMSLRSNEYSLQFYVLHRCCLSAMPTSLRI